MDWTNKHFNHEDVFPAPPGAVLEATWAFAAETLPDWHVDEKPDGFEAVGRSGMHKTTANCRIEPAPAGTKVAIEFLVQRQSAFGFMLVDIGGYYDGQLRKWLWGIDQQLRAMYAARPWGAVYVPRPPRASEPMAQVGMRVFFVDAEGHQHVGRVQKLAGPLVLIALEAGGERWVPAVVVHVVPG